ncbi:MAG: diadenylate cyclase [Thermoplasmata archaeon]|nr:MAG: diadenylate cyclase [Thermoplasmata archaeon]
MDCFVESAKNVADEMDVTFLYVITNDAGFIDSICQEIPNISTLIATSDRKLSQLLRDREMSVKKLSKSPLKGINILAQSKELLLSAWGEGILSLEDRVLCIISTDIKALLFFDVKDMGIASIKEKVADRIDLSVLEAAFNIATQIAREGREGKPAGALLVLGDTDNVMKNSRELIINPFEGHEKDGRHLLSEQNLATIKEFALLDGALIVDKEGYAVAGGRYIVGVDWDLYLQGGLGGRHLAGASITKTTKAISIVVSSTGTIRAYRDGEEIYRTGVS